MNKNLVMVALVLAGVVMLQKKAQAQAAPKASAPIANRNINDDMWSKLLGQGWKQFTDGEGASFLRKNLLGQVVNSDGVPITTGDTATDYMATNLGFTQEQAEYGKQGFFATETMTGRDVTDPMQGFRNPNDYFNNPDYAYAF